MDFSKTEKSYLRKHELNFRTKIYLLRRRMANSRKVLEYNSQVLIIIASRFVKTLWRKKNIQTKLGNKCFCTFS